MDAAVWGAIARGLTCDITTTGRASGAARRIEIWYFVVGGQVYLCGTPGPRDWLANLRANPRLTFHVKEGARADLAARAEEIVDPAARRPIMAAIMQANDYFTPGDLEAWVAGSPLVAIHFDAVS